MFAALPEAFDREQGCTVDEWLRCLPGAAGGHPLQRTAPDEALVQIGPGRLRLQWTAQPPRQIALMRLPRLHVSYRFDGVDADARAAFMRHFDLVLQRGGG